MLTALMIGFCVLVFVVALLRPRASRQLERGGKKPLALGQRAGSKAPGKLGELARKPFEKASKAVSKSGQKGREERFKLRM